MSEAAKQLAKMLEKSKRTVFFGGAGVSTESGIPDFRSAHGLYGGAKGKSLSLIHISTSKRTSSATSASVHTHRPMKIIRP